jgi:hypothetical protein
MLTVAENLAPPGFDPRTVQLVASRYTGYAIPAHGPTFTDTTFQKSIFASLHKEINVKRKGKEKINQRT